MSLLVILGTDLGSFLFTFRVYRFDKAYKAYFLQRLLVAGPLYGSPLFAPPVSAVSRHSASMGGRKKRKKRKKRGDRWSAVI